MNVTIENLAPCKKLIRVEAEPQVVDEAFNKTAKEFQKQASLPGFRPGKAPLDMVVRSYDKGIREEVRKKLMSDAYQKAVSEHKIPVVGSPEIEEVQFDRGQKFQVAILVETAPDFTIPEYKGLTAKIEAKTVTEDDVNRAIDLLRERQKDFKTVDRPVQDNDIAVISYQGTSDGKPLTDIAPTAKGLTQQSHFWVEIKPGSFIPGFTEQLRGMKAGDKKNVEVEFPADFVAPALAGKKGVYEVEVNEVKEAALPALDDSFAKSYGADDVEKLREGVRKDLANELEFSKKKSIRGQLIKTLLDQVQCELPESVVAHETRNVVYNIVQENQKRGIPREAIEAEKDSIFQAASQSAKDRVKSAFLLGKIAEKESISVSREELANRVLVLAQMYQIPPEKFVKDLQKRDGMSEIHDQILSEKVLDLVEKNAKIEETA